MKQKTKVKNFLKNFFEIANKINISLENQLKEKREKAQKHYIGNNWDIT